MGGGYNLLSVSCNEHSSLFEHSNILFFGLCSTSTNIIIIVCLLESHLGNTTEVCTFEQHDPNNVRVASCITIVQKVPHHTLGMDLLP